MNKRLKKGCWAAAVCLLLLMGGAALTGYLCLFRPIGTAEFGRIYIDRDDSADSVCIKLQRLSPTAARGYRWLGLRHAERPVHTGCYLLSSTDRPWDIARRLERGNQSPVRLVFHNLRTHRQLAERLAEQLMLEAEEIEACLADTAYCRQWGFEPSTIACLFLPDTYEVYWDITPDKLFRRMKQEYDRFWTPARLELAAGLGLSPIEVATLASIVEEETNSRQEQPIVAGLYLNRLRKGMLLQACPTVKFALQDFSLRRILTVHLSVDSPYNTYLHAGLPPGPIRFPSKAGLESVLHTTRHSYLYMCAKEDFSGRHNFATTLAEHQANARRYQQALNNRKIY